MLSYQERAGALKSTGPLPYKERTGAKMTHPNSIPTSIAILGTEALSEDILARLLEREGYNTRILEANPTGLAYELLDGVDVLLLAPCLDAGLRRALVETMRSNPKTSHIQALSFSAALRQALL